MEDCKKERVKGLKWSSSDKKEECRMDAKCNGGSGGGSEGEEGYIFRSPLNANGISSRKRVKLQGKVSEVCGPVNPALVPRRLRSAMNKRISPSVSPPVSDSQKRQQPVSIGTPLFNSSSAERFKQNMLDEVTKDEEEVAVALTSMASLISIGEPVKTKEDGRILEENSEMNAPLASPLEASKDQCATVLCNGTTTMDPSLCAENSPETMKADPSILEQPTTASVRQKFDSEANGPSQPDSLRKLLSNMEPVEGVTHLKDDLNISNSLGSQYFPGNGMLQPSKLDALLVQKQDLGLWPLGPASVEHDLQSSKQKPECVSHDVSLKVLDVQPGLHSRGREQLTMPSLSKAVAYTNSVSVSGRPGLPTEKFSLASADKKRPWNKCTTHVYISHLIRNYQKAEKKQPSMPQGNQSKAREGTNCSVPTSGETGVSRNYTIPPQSSASLIERSMLEARNRMLQDGRLLQAQQAAALSGAYTLQKQGCDLLSLSAAGDIKSSGNGMKSSGQLHAPFPPSIMPFTYPRGSYTSQYQEQLAAAGTQQVQLQLPHYIASSQLYGSHMGQAAGVAATKQEQQQQQLMWQAHLAHYRPLVGLAPKWPPQHDLPSSSPLISQPPPSTFPLPADFNPQNLTQPFILPMPSSALSSKSKQKQQRSGGGLNPHSSSQLQMVCNADSFR